MKYKTHDAGKINIQNDVSGLHEGQFIAYASTWTRRPDCYGDVVARGAFQDTLKEWKAKQAPIPILYGHDESDPNKNIGYVIEALEDEHGLKILGQLDIDENPEAKQVWRLLKGHRLTQMSFGYTVSDEAIVETPDGPANELRSINLYEVSIVPRGANADTSIEAVKSASEKIVPSIAMPNTSAVELSATEEIYKDYLRKVDAAVVKYGTKSTAQLRSRASEFYTYLKDLRAYKAKTDDDLVLTKIAKAMPDKVRLIQRRAKLEGRELSYQEREILDHAAEEQQHQMLLDKAAKKNLAKLNSLSTNTEHEEMEHEEMGHEEDKLHDIIKTYSVKKVGNKYVNGGLSRGRLDLRSIAKAAPAYMVAYSQSRGIKTGLDLNGSTLFSVPIVNEDPISDANSEIPLSLLDYLHYEISPTPEYDILVQKTPENAGSALVVPKGEEKPKYQLGLTTEHHTLKVIAVMTDPIDKYLFTDLYTLSDGGLLRFIGNSLTQQIWRTLEKEILEGDGSDRHLMGLANVTGTKTQKYEGNTFDTVAAALASIQTQNIKPCIIALNPADWLAMCTSKDKNGRYMTNNIVDASAARLFGVQVAPASGLPVGTGWVIGKDAVMVATDGVMHSDWNEGGELFERNQVMFRVESRFSFDVLKPHALCKFSLTDAKA